MNTMAEKDLNALSTEMNRLQSQIADLGDSLNDVLGQTGDVARRAGKVGKRAWTTAGNEAQYLADQVEDHPILWGAILAGFVAIALAIVFGSSRS